MNKKCMLILYYLDFWASKNVFTRVPCIKYLVLYKHLVKITSTRLVIRRELQQNQYCRKLQQLIYINCFDFPVY